MEQKHIVDGERKMMKLLELIVDGETVFWFIPQRVASQFHHLLGEMNGHDDGDMWLWVKSKPGDLG